MSGESPELVTQRLRLDAVDGDALTGNLDHGQELAVSRLELRVSGDVDLLDNELQIGSERRQIVDCTLAEVAAASRVDGDDGHAHG